MSNQLTQKEEVFTLELFKTDNQRKSFLHAFPHTRKWKIETVDSKASTLANSGKVKERLQELREAAKEASKITVEEVVSNLANTIRVRECDFYHDDGSVKLLSDLTDEQKSALAYYSVKRVKNGKDENGNPQYIDIPVFKTHDRDKNADMLMKHLGGYAPKKVEHSGEIRTGMDSFYAEQ